MPPPVPDSKIVTEILPEKKQLPLQGLYLDQRLATMSAQMEKALVVTTFLADRNGVIAKADEHHHFHVPAETRNASDWRLSQELMAQADVIICGGSYLRRLSAAGSHAQDILNQFEPGGEFEELGEWRLRAGYPRRSPDLAVIAHHLDFDIPEQVLRSGRRTAIFTTKDMADSDRARDFTASGTTIVAGGESHVAGSRMIDYLRDDMGHRVIVMASGPRVLELLLRSKRLELLYLTQVEREIPFDDPSTVTTLLPNGQGIEDLKGFRLTHRFFQEHAVAADGSDISQFFARYDREGLSQSAA